MNKRKKELIKNEINKFKTVSYIVCNILHIFIFFT